MPARTERIHFLEMLVVLAVTTAFGNAVTLADDANRIQPYAANPFYWQYKGKPVLLLGGSREDNLFNQPDGLAEHLDALAACGGNYIRNTMSSRNPGNVWAFKRLDNGRYDLQQWNQEYWNRFENLLRLCRDRDIIVQIELWDPWDYFKSTSSLRGFDTKDVGWESCPYNPALNVNYTAAESGLAEKIDYYPRREPSDHLFFHTPPGLKDVLLVRTYQEAFVDKLLSISLAYPNVLYCMNNEIGEPPEWGQHWAKFIRARAEKAGNKAFLTDMRRITDFSSAEQVKMMHDRKHFDFFEISQNNHNDGQQHYDHIKHIRSQLTAKPIPINNVKIYGGRRRSKIEEGTHRFWRNVFGGCASARFHRPGPSRQYFGLGLSELAQTHIRSMRKLTDAMNVFACTPRNDLLSDRQPNQAYCLAKPGERYAVYFPDSGGVKLDVSAVQGELEVRWLDIARSAWQEPQIVSGGGTMQLKTPGKGQWAALVLASVRGEAALALSIPDQEKARVVVMTDIGGDPDDHQSLVRFLLDTCDFKVEGLCTGFGWGHYEKTRPDLIREAIKAYGEVLPNLKNHRKDFPSEEHLLSLVKDGHNGDPHTVGPGMDSEASDWIIEVVDRDDPRPVWFAIWGGPRELAQAIWKVQTTRSKEQLTAFKKKIRVHSIADQDKTAKWVKQHHPDVFWIFSERLYQGFYAEGDQTLVSPQWIERHVHGPLKRVYPAGAHEKVGVKEGDTPSFLYLVPNGLSDPKQPEQGNWGGRFVRSGRGHEYIPAPDLLDDRPDLLAAIHRWRPAYQNAFEARFDWCVLPFDRANHGPVAHCNGDTSLRVLHVPAAPGARVQLSADGSFDPDGDRLEYRWWTYREAGTCRAEPDIAGANQAEAVVTVPQEASGRTIHIVLEIRDAGKPPLTAYRRVVLEVSGEQVPPLSGAAEEKP